jgi:hypothetical protein
VTSISLAETDVFKIMTASVVVARVPNYRSGGPAFDSPCYQIFCVAVGLERDPFSLVKITEELLEGKVAAPV